MNEEDVQMTLHRLTRFHHWRTLTAAAIIPLFMLALGVIPAHAAASTATPAHSAPIDIQEDGDDDDHPRFHGLVEQMPAGGRIGDWVIGGQAVVATAQTEFDETDGAIAVGVCVEVEFVSQGSTTAHEIDSESADDCDGDDDDCDDGDDDCDDDDNDVEVYGVVEAMPSGGAIGAWTVSGKVYTVTAQSELEAEHGAFDIGRCVEIHLVAGTTDIVREMETEPGYKCNGYDDDDTPPTGAVGEGELYGELISFPPNLIGNWVVGTMTFSATTETEFEMKNGPFTVGKTVKVEFYVMQDGSLLADEIKTATPDWDDDDDDDGDHGDDDHGGRGEGHAFGVIERLPEGGLIGTWVVAGIPYTVTERTELDAEGGVFAVDATVKVEFKLDSSGGRVAKEIELKSPQGAPEEATFVGFVETMPATGYVGLWIVSGVEFSGTAQSKFEEDHGVLTVGAYVEVEYLVVNGVRVIHEMETEVPPGAGDDDFVGTVESLDDSALAAGVAANSTWVIGGRSFVATASTRVDSNLAANDTAWVNSYTAADGTQVMTRVEGVTLDKSLYLPTLRR
jgi:hypothetical protein